MSFEENDKKEEVDVQSPGTLKNISINMYCMDKKTINRTAKDFSDFVSEFDRRGEAPMALPISEACFTVRKSPCGNGTATFSRIKMRVFQTLFKLSVFDKDITSIVEFLKSSPVDVTFKAE